MNPAPHLLAAFLGLWLCCGRALAETPPPEAAAASPSALIDLNTASAAELESLPGIGPSRAQAILDFRDAHGGFRSVSQLLRIRGIGRAMLRKLRALVTVSAAPSSQQAPAATGHAPRESS